MAVGDIYTGITVQGLYNEQSGDALYGVLGTTAPASALFMAGKDQTSGFLTPISVDSTGKVNVNASITPPSDNTATTTLSGGVAASLPISTEGTSALMVQVTVAGGYDGTLQFEASIDDATWQPLKIYPVFPDGTPSVSSTTTSGFWTSPVGGIRQFRVRNVPGTTGTAVVFLTAGQGQYSVQNVSDVAANFNATVVQGTAANLNATVVQGTSPWVVSGTVTANAGTGTFNVAPNNTTWTLTGTSADVNITGGTVTVSGTVTANQGTSPWVDNLTQVAGVALGATAVTAFGTAPAAANVPGVNASLFAGTTGITATGSSLNVDVTNTVTVTGTVAVTQSTSPWVVAGNLTNNNAAPGAANVGVLPALANAASPTWTEGDQVLESVDLSGRQRVRGTLTTNNAAPAADNIGVLPAVVASGTFPATTLPALTGGDQALVSITQGGSLRVIPADEANAASINYFSADQGDAQTSIANPAVKPLISIRTNSASILVQLRSFTALGGGQLVRYQIIKNATLTGATFAATSPSANTQVDTAATSFSGGTVVDSGYFGATQFQKAVIYALAAGTPGDRFTLAASSISGTVKVSGSLQWSEQSAAI